MRREQCVTANYRPKIMLPPSCTDARSPAQAQASSSMPVKDSVNIKDYPTTGGTPALRNFHPAEDAKLIRILVDDPSLS